MFNDEDPICKLYIDPFTIEIDNESATFYLVDSKDEEKKYKILIINTQSSSFLQDLEKKTKMRKYKSCLSFEPNVAHHTSILSG